MKKRAQKEIIVKDNSQSTQAFDIASNKIRKKYPEKFPEKYSSHIDYDKNTETCFVNVKEDETHKVKVKINNELNEITIILKNIKKLNT